MDYPLGKRRMEQGKTHKRISVAGGFVTRRAFIFFFFHLLPSAHFHPVICPFYDNNIKLLPLIRLSLEGNEVDGGGASASAPPKNNA